MAAFRTKRYGCLPGSRIDPSSHMFRDNLAVPICTTPLDDGHTFVLDADNSVTYDEFPVFLID